MIDWTSLIERLHQTSNRIVLSVTGGGSGAISRLLSIPGASNTILEAAVPYSQAALSDWLGSVPDSYCSRETALGMAAVAWCRATSLAGGSNSNEATTANQSPIGSTNPIGVACSASLVSSKPKRGEHRCWVAVQTNNSAHVYSLALVKGHRDRAEEESVAADLILQAVLEVTGIAQASTIGRFAIERLANEPTARDSAADHATSSPSTRNNDETVVIESEIAAAEIADVVNRRSPLIWSMPDGSFATVVDCPKGILSGSFNPLHVAHKGLADAAAKILDGDVYFELPIRNAEKPPLDFFSIEDRRRQFTTRPVALTTSPLFVQKAELFPNTTFVIGMDTATRILDPRFYNDSADQMREALRVIYRHGCRFLVAARLRANGLQTLDGLSTAKEFGDLFTAIPADVFREDVSSTELRKRRSASVRIG